MEKGGLAYKGVGISEGGAKGGSIGLPACLFVWGSSCSHRFPIALSFICQRDTLYVAVLASQYIVSRDMKVSLVDGGVLDTSMPGMRSLHAYILCSPMHTRLGAGGLGRRRTGVVGLRR